MHSTTNRVIAILSVLLLASAPALSRADESAKPAAGTPQAQKQDSDKGAGQQIESGARQIGRGAGEAAKGVVQGSKEIGRKVEEAANEAKPQVKSAWESFKTGAVDAGRSVKRFFAQLFRG